MIAGISYDGRKDKTRALVEDSNGQVHPRIIKEEHLSVTVDPKGATLHTSPLSQPSTQISQPKRGLYSNRQVLRRPLILLEVTLTMATQAGEAGVMPT